MQPQGQAEDELNGLYRGLLALVVLLLLLAVLGFKYFGSIDAVTGSSLRLEHGRWLNIVAMAHSQWMGQGRNDSLMLEWEAAGQQVAAEPVLIHMNDSGWPQPPQQDAAGCAQLWQQLLGYGSEGRVTVMFDAPSRSCRYQADGGSFLDYQPDSGSITLTDARD